MAVLAFLLIAGALSTFAILRSGRVPPVGQLFPQVALPVFHPEASPTGGDLATRGVPPSATPSPSPEAPVSASAIPEAVGTGSAPTGAAPAPPPPEPPPTSAPPSATSTESPTVEPSPTASATEPTASATEPTSPPETSLPAEGTPTGREIGSAG